MDDITSTTFFKENRSFILAIRQALLMIVDALERGLGEPVTTAEMRRQFKEAHGVKSNNNL